MEDILKFLKEEKGIEVIEYCIALSGLIIGTIASIILLGDGIMARFSSIVSQLP